MSTAVQSFLPIPPQHDFPLANLPYGVVERVADRAPRPVARIGDWVVDLSAADAAGLFRGTAASGAGLFERPTLNAFVAAGAKVWHDVRTRLTELLRADTPTLRDNAELRARVLLPLEEVSVCLPLAIGDYTDFYSSRHHAYNVGCMFRDPNNALLPNYLWLPVGYHGRASSIVVSGTDIRRPQGQVNANDAQPPGFGPTKMLDFELEMGFFVGPGNRLGEPIPIDSAAEHIFGLVLVNDWSARDIQRWEYVPLGPFLAKNFATTISPWVVPLAALAPFRCPGPVQEPAPLPYLRPADTHFSFDIQLEVALKTPQLATPHVICRSNFNHLYWTIAQQLAHHTVNGCNLRPGDLLASGTISGPTPESFGSLLELAWKGTRPLTLPGGEQRSSLQDHDTLILRAWCENAGLRIGFGECTGTILPATSAAEPAA